VIVVVAGRRIDAADAEQARFPLQNVSLVKTLIRTKLEELGASVLICSAACGGDLIALCEAGTLGLRRKIVLPYGRERFRQTSVVDRPGDWGACYDEILDQVEAAGDLVVVSTVSEKDAYSVTNHRILDESISLSQQLHRPVTALLIWEGVSRGSNDLTAALGVEARNRGLPVVQVRTDVAGTILQ
jgi:hypothetical protein